MGGKVLIVLTSHDALGNTGKKTGWYLPEVAHPYEVFQKNGYTCDFISPKGGEAPMDPGSLEAFKDDAVCKRFLADEAVMAQVKNTKTPDQVSASEYNVIFYAGGHGPMYDLPDNTPIANLAAQVYENGGIVSAVCHGTVGLIPVKLSNGDPIVKGQKVTSFSNSEEDAVQLSSAMPFMLETRLKELGAIYEAVANFQTNVCVSGRIITGQNPASATPLAENIVEMDAAKKKS
ncbi:uncharacterized protein LOC143294078 [Babylonia areolata]|uniref:uncharacterized protein LOC143294078 n=1 Tax=Babylonia areolata TaxID=304850 RepID=UPI003FD4D93B